MSETIKNAAKLLLFAAPVRVFSDFAKSLSCYAIQIRNKKWTLSWL